jgi:hypothetical protein
MEFVIWATSNSDYIARNCRMIIKCLERLWKEAVVACLRQQGLRVIPRRRQVSRCPNRDSRQASTDASHRANCWVKGRITGNTGTSCWPDSFSRIFIPLLKTYIQKCKQRPNRRSNICYLVSLDGVTQSTM